LKYLLEGYLRLLPYPLVNVIGVYSLTIEKKSSAKHLNTLESTVKGILRDIKRGLPITLLVSITAAMAALIGTALYYLSNLLFIGIIIILGVLIVSCIIGWIIEVEYDTRS
jgi:hypothetical protein